MLSVATQLGQLSISLLLAEVPVVVNVVVAVVLVVY
jgi:hypothetical protein